MISVLGHMRGRLCARASAMLNCSSRRGMMSSSNDGGRPIETVTASQHEELEATLRKEADEALTRSSYKLYAMLCAMGFGFVYLQYKYPLKDSVYVKGRHFRVEEKAGQVSKPTERMEITAKDDLSNSTAGSTAKTEMKTAISPKQDKETSEGSATSPLDPEEWRAFTLKDAIEISHNTKLYRFALPDSSSSLNLPVASCLLVKAPQKDGKDAVRPYTPITSAAVTGHFDLVVKTYKDGKVSGYLWDLTPGATVEMKGPYKKIDYFANAYKRVGMIAGGTGIAPMLQVIEEVLKNPLDSTQIALVFANVSPKDILLKPKLDRFAEAHPKRFKVHYVVEKSVGQWSQSKGYVTPEILSKYMPTPDDDMLIMVCGPPPMMEAVSGNKAQDKSQGELKGILKAMGYTEKQIFKF